MNRNNYDSGNENITTLDSENLRGINTNNIKTNIIKTDSINLNSDKECLLNDLKNQCKLNEFEQKDRIILEDVIDCLYYKNTLKVGNVTVNHNKVLDKLKLIIKDNLIQLLDILKSSDNIKNIKNYLMICLYNNLGNTYIKTSKKSITLESENETYHSVDFWNSLYDNDYYDPSIQAS